jgi:hypothetical protein
MTRIIYLLLLSYLCISGVQAQSLILHINGDVPDTLGDKTGNNLMNNVGGVYLDNGALAFDPVINSYLSTDSLSKFMAVNQDWTVECRLKVSDSTDEVALIDFRSTSQTGNMYLYYNRNNKGLHFSDRNLNGDAGHLVADYLMLPQNTWVTVKLEKANGHLKLYRDGVVTADTVFTGTLSPIATTTIGYSEDRREIHALFWMDDVKIWSGIPTAIHDRDANNSMTIFPNPASLSFTIGVKEAIHEVNIYDMTGKTVLSTASKTIQVDRLVPGTYLIIVQTKDGSIKKGKLIKN